MKGTHKIPKNTLPSDRRIYNIHFSYLRIGDHLNSILEEVHSNVAVASGALYELETCRIELASAFQVGEGFSDAKGCEATRGGKDWRYALYLPAQHPGIPAPLFCEFRRSLLDTNTSLVEFSVLLSTLYQYGLPGLSQYVNKDPESAIISSCQVSFYNYLHQAMKNAAILAATSKQGSDAGSDFLDLRTRYSAVALPVDFPNVRELVIASDRLGRDIALFLREVTQNKDPELETTPEIRLLEDLFTNQMRLHEGAYTWSPQSCANCFYHSSIPGGAL